ncbi:MAG: ECF transporter S component [Armatimonadota bacterium]|nr:ECF transporter S component [Armatimonadota bacterium]
MRMSTRELTLTALLVALVAVATMAFRIPIPATQGYFNLGETMVYLSALLFGPWVGGVAGGIGSALADVLGGYTQFAPFTLVIKGFEGFVAGVLAQRSVPRATYLGAAFGVLGGIGLVIPADLLSKVGGILLLLAVVIAGFLHLWAGVRPVAGRVFILLVAGAVMVGGYFLTEAFLLGLGIPAALGEVPANVMQVVSGLVIAIPLSEGLRPVVLRRIR